MKIFAYVGSYRDNLSYTYYFVNTMIAELKNTFEIENKDIFICSPNYYEIKQCVGCNQCFIKGYCSLKDDIDLIKRKMTESDIIILASPIYVHQVSGNFKTFVDRIGHWTHIMKLTGKLGVTISLSDNNGNEFATEYISKIMQYLGISIISNIEIRVQSISKGGIDSIIRYESKKIIKSIKRNNFQITPLQELYYQKQRNSILNNNNDIGNYERDALVKENIIHYEHFIDFFKSKSNLK